MKAYLISGLGADERAFSRIVLPPYFEIVHLNWFPPLEKESLEDYAARFAEKITNDEEFILIGLSFGGMLVSELSKIKTPRKKIIISSVSNYEELPWYFKSAGKMGLQRIITPGVYKSATILNRFMGPGDKEMKAIVYDYVRNADPAFIRWSLDAILHWKHRHRLDGLVHIHGSSDHLLPCKFVKADHVIEKGGHLMVFNKADEVNRVLQQILAG